MKTLTGFPCDICRARSRDPAAFGGDIPIPVPLVKALSRTDDSATYASAEYNINGVDAEDVLVSEIIVDDVELITVEVDE